MKSESNQRKGGLRSPFAKNLKSLLEERKLSQRAAAELAGVRPSVINDWLAGGNPLNLDAVLKLCVALKADFQWLLTGTQSDTNRQDISMSELFESTDEPALSGLFLIEAKRLKRKSKS